jgi:hypothetical protein
MNLDEFKKVLLKDVEDFEISYKKGLEETDHYRQRNSLHDWQEQFEAFSELKYIYRTQEY